MDKFSAPNRQLCQAVFCLAGLVTVVVLDEADKMLSMGFEPQLTRLRRMLCPPKAAAARAASRAAPGLCCAGRHCAVGHRAAAAHVHAARPAAARGAQPCMA